ncbi:hypothetical protein LTR10_008968 [Elasticomyces elasticus]|nr:hypothetical protein LTR10_008968 [Elasticomyces elasticus]KAK4964802.1 hypothetical protein LTR42_012749 [Elasticomyces elasticus]
MPSSSIDKTVAAAPVSPAFNQPNSADFLPKYEETLNHNLRNFGDPEAQKGPVDSMQEPLKYGLTKKRRAIVVGSLIALVLIMGAVLVGVLSTKLTAGKQQTPLSTRATELQSQATSAEVTTSSSHFTDTAAPTPSVISATTLTTTVTAKPQTTPASDSLPLVITSAFWSKTAPDASFEVFTTTLSGKKQSTFFTYSPPTATPTSTSTKISTSTSSVLTANKSIVASVLSSLQAHATMTPSTSSQATQPLPPPTSVSMIITATPVGASTETKSLVKSNWIGYCGVRGSFCAKK